MKYIISIVLIIVAVIAFRFATGSGNLDAGPNQVQEKIKKGALVVDVRTPAEFSAGHYEGAINIPLDQVQSRMNEFGDKDKPIIVYCRSGNRSGQAKKILESSGFKDVINGGGLTSMPSKK